MTLQGLKRNVYFLEETGFGQDLSTDLNTWREWYKGHADAAGVPAQIPAPFLLDSHTWAFLAKDTPLLEEALD